MDNGGEQDPTQRAEYTMAGTDRNRHDGSRRRCLMCGHPKVEHWGDEKCTVPKCLCGEYKGATLVGEAPRPT
jgi:hypothetical protein